MQRIKLTLLLTALLSLRSEASTVISQTTNNTNGIVLMCTGANWSGDCLTVSVPVDETCIELAAPWYHNITSLEPAYGTVCYRYQSGNCSEICYSPSGCNMMIQFPGFADLSKEGAGTWDKNVGSFLCAPTEYNPNNPN